MSTQPTKHADPDQDEFISRLQCARELGGDVVELMLMTMTELGLLEQSLDADEYTYAPTQGLAELLGLHHVGVGVAAGEWIRFEMDGRPI